MRDYSKVSPLSWIGMTANVIRAEAERDPARRDHARTCLLTLQYLMSGPNSSMLGIYSLPLATLADQVMTTKEGALEALRSLQVLEFCVYDEAVQWVWVCEMAAWQIDRELRPSDNRIKGIAKDWLALPNLRMLEAFYDRYRAAFHLPVRSSSKAPTKDLLSPSEGPLKPVTVTVAVSVAGTGDKPAASPVGSSLEPTFHEELELSPVFIELPLNTGELWQVREALVEEWQGLYQAVDVRQELRKMRGWCDAKKSNRKTRLGVKTFANNWLARQQDRGGIAPRTGSNNGQPASGGAQPAAQSAWRQVMAAVERGKRPETWIDPIIPKALDAIGGWSLVKDIRTDDVPFRQRDFLAAYSREVAH